MADDESDRGRQYWFVLQEYSMSRSVMLEIIKGRACPGQTAQTGVKSQDGRCNLYIDRLQPLETPPPPPNRACPPTSVPKLVVPAIARMLTGNVVRGACNDNLGTFRSISDSLHMQLRASQLLSPPSIVLRSHSFFFFCQIQLLFFPFTTHA